MHAAALRDLTEAAVASQDPVALSRDVMPALLRLSGADDGAIFHFAPGGARFHYGNNTTLWKSKAGIEWFEKHAATDAHFVANARRNLLIDRATEQVSARDAEPVLSEFYGPLGLRDWLITRFGETPVGHVGHAGVILFRRERGAWSSKEESAFLPINELLASTVQRIETARSDFALFHALLAEVVTGIHVLFDASGDVRWMSTEATYHFALTPLSRLPHGVRAAAMALASSRGAAVSRIVSDPHVVALRRMGVGDETYVLARFSSPRGSNELSRREREVVELIMKGHHPKLIAHDLGIAHATVRVLLARAMAKLGAKSSRDLAAPSSRVRVPR